MVRLTGTARPSKELDLMRMALVDPAGIVVGLLDWDTAATFTPPAGHVLRPAGDAHVGDTGVIPNSALNSPVKVKAINQGLPINFAPTAIMAGWATIATLPLVVPDRITSACIALTTRVMARNTTTASDGLGAGILIDSILTASEGGQPVAPGIDANVIFTANYALSVVPGSTVNIDVVAWTGLATWPAFLTNGGTVTGFVLWTR